MASASLPDDLALEVLERVKDVATLFRCATACKGWCRLVVANPTFLRRCLPEDACYPFVGFFTQQRCRDGVPFIPGPRPVLDPSRRFLGSLVPNINDKFNQPVPLTSRQGLLLVRLNRYQGCGLLGVCNLITGTFDVLPPLEHAWNSDNNHLAGYAILTARDCSSSGGHPDEQQLPFFKVMILTIDVNMMQYNLQTISSANEPGWKISFGSLKNKSPSIYMVLRQHNAVVCRGMAHWLFWSTSGLYTLDVDARTDHVSFTNLLDMGRIDNYFGPPTYDAPYLAVNGKGRLMLVYLNKGGYRLEICTSHNNGRWHHALARKLKQPNQKKNEKKTQGKVLYTCLGEKNGTLIIKDNHHDAYVIHINTGVVQEVIDSPHTRRLNREKTVPFEMDWPAFFVSQLAVVPTW
ncbi:hypothetical protein VPH35_017516 [Triticum aestivum]